ncbi:hypothetical protein BGW38_003381 [Lunasporangiospora selenospora]|uniref:Uncharacterized protein n=1 Tax=Lunasporangiospora selenospora TaxID=979761 RepID=A0A9P6KCR2_9FUNG|nr:hypothetical protein BGW38_003381 [Lunasporangiospora selenospora]
MATETVIYVSLALVLLTRIFVFISPPEFLEEHQERRYHDPSAGGTASLRDLERDNDLWRQILYSSEAASVPSFLTLDLSEIHYNGSLDDKFERDSEVLESIRALRAGQRDVNKECPDMTVVWEGGRWCCLEGRTLYILRALQWQGKVKVRVLVDKDPTLLAPKHGPNPTQSQSQSRSSGIKATTATAAAASGSFTIGLSLEDANEPVTAATISTTTTKASAEAMLEQAPGQQQNHVGGR